ncbi:DUF1684 domain-containing protein [Flavobacteriaceae bacterium]|nr:DUF1684 domain-containing protein [Flavobacteriaceae bacterium]MDB9874078.1 DUF1684 domain-containing protein [Flavobacteriaceae bacterium]
MKTNSIFYSALILLIFIGCQSQKRPLKAQSEFQAQQNSFFKDASKSPLKSKDLKSFEGLFFFPIDSVFVVEAQLTRTPNTSFFDMKTTTKRVTKERVYGVLSFTINKESYKLNVYQGAPDPDDEVESDYLFLPFLDDTNGTETYGGGRYIDLSIPDGNQLTIDFNKSYNPYCAYNEKYSCPIVPRENYLSLKINAGVKRFKDH